VNEANAGKDGIDGETTSDLRLQYRDAVHQAAGLGHWVRSHGTTYRVIEVGGETTGTYGRQGRTIKERAPYKTAQKMPFKAFSSWGEGLWTAISFAKVSEDRLAVPSRFVRRAGDCEPKAKRCLRQGFQTGSQVWGKVEP
jgi:hypothetical protein